MKVSGLVIMKERINDKYCPDIAIPPGETLLEIIEEIRMTQVERTDLVRNFNSISVKVLFLQH